jgi:cytochrome P450
LRNPNSSENASTTHAHPDTGTPTSDKSIAGGLITFAHVGAGDTAFMIQNILADLGRNPNWLEACQKECRDFVTKRDWKALLESPLIHAVILESTRVNMNSIGIPKKIMRKNTAVVGNYYMGNSDVVMLGGPLVVESSGFTDLEKYDPARFMGEEGKGISRMIPGLNFGMGRSGCPGQQLVFYKVKIGLAMFLTHMELDLSKTVISEDQIPSGSAMLTRSVRASVKFLETRQNMP